MSSVVGCVYFGCEICAAASKLVFTHRRGGKLVS
jgi:hypothetical protein